MDMNTLTYSRCACEQCGNHYATALQTDEELGKEACPNCGQKQLKLIGPLTVEEMSGLFAGGG